MKDLEITQWVVVDDNGVLFKTYSKSTLLAFMDTQYKKGVQGLCVYQSFQKKEFNKIMNKIGKGQFLVEARNKYGCENVIMVDGDLFYIKSCNGVYFVGKRILKDLTLSAEDFKINL